jgi:hypothetical protein
MILLGASKRRLFAWRASGCQWQNAEADGAIVTPPRRSGKKRDHPGAPRAARGVGRGRTTRRTLARGGTGPAHLLNDALGAWADVRITPMFGRWGYFAGSRLFACFPLRAKETDLWVRLPLEAQSRALTEAGIRPHRRFGGRGWIEMEVRAPSDVGRALRWLRRAHAAALGAPDTDD